MTAPRLNKTGRIVWFIRPPQSEGTIRPVTSQGWIAIATALALVLICGLGAMIGIALTQAPWPLIVAFIVAAAGLGVFGILAYRHTE